MTDRLRRRVLPVVGALVLAVVVLAGLIAVFGANPTATAIALWNGVVGSPFTIGQTITIASVLALTAISALVPFTAQLWNVGAEGQLYAGAIGSVSVALTMGSGPGTLTLICSVLAGIASGAVWGLVPGILRTVWGASEMIVSLLMNFLALLAANYVITRIFPDSSGQSTRTVTPNAQLPVLWTAGSVNLGVIFTILVVIAIGVMLGSTRFGFAVRAAGLNARAARLAGFGDRSTSIATFAIAGGVAGLAGAVLVLGTSGHLSTGFSANYGFIGVAVALVAGLRPIFVIPSALFFGALSVGSNSLQVAVGLPKDLGSVLVAVLVIVLLAVHVIRIRQRGAAA
ncbi:ABC transporter permease [Glaciihabitans sp. dw_435]|uniref:ABC transporter permease n=1 Tax=Glaciihabitans sp. dw_435 TaxID=2720081 RepID=UPI001BD5F9F1|nr:ABC transporter permease [Glaciihabitans sp. dw_435]